jgi:hypothetical protein
LSLLFSLVVFGRNDRETGTGEVKDQGGAVIPGASVVATNRGTGGEAKTSTTETGAGDGSV